MTNLFINFFNAVKVTSLECMSVINQKCISTPKTIDTNANEPVFYPYSIKINKCSGSGKNINYPFTKICVPDVVKNNIVKVFNLCQELMK